MILLYLFLDQNLYKTFKISQLQNVCATKPPRIVMRAVKI